MDKTPKISVVMSCYNRENYIRESIESILNQTFTDFEFIITDDCSSDNTINIVEEYAQKDSRIIFIKNEKNSGLIHNLNLGISKAQGEYIARMDDDDISLPERFEKQVKYMDENSDITVLGSFIEAFGCEGAKSWISITDADELEVAINFYNPMCHPSVMMRKSFLQQHNLKYSTKAWHAEEYDLWKEIVLNGGKLANIPEILLKYRTHKKSITQSEKTSKIQNKTAENIRKKLLCRFFKNKKSCKKIRQKIFKYPFECNNKKEISNVLEIMKKYPQKISTSGINKFEKRFLGKPSQMEIFFSSSDYYSKYLTVAIASILKNALPFDNFNFYILDGGISEKNKQKILSLKKIKDFNIEFINVDDSLFENIQIPPDCGHISKQTYYRYLIPIIKPELEKSIYLDSDIVVTDSLNELWNTELNTNYVGVVEELYKGTDYDCKNLGVNEYFNAGILLINNALWKKDNISDILFQNTFKLQNKIRWADQDILNYTFKNRIQFLHPKYNLQQNAFFDLGTDKYTEEEINQGIYRPVIVHFNGCTKPWSNHCEHKLWTLYYHYLKYTPFKKDYIKFKIKHKIKPKFKKIVENIFSIKNNGIHKNICIFGLKLKIKSKRLIEREKYERLLNEFAYTRDCLNNKIDLAMKENQELSDKITNSTISIENNLKTFIQEKSDYLNHQIKWNVGEQIGKSLSVYNLHQKVFPKYKNINEGKDVVLVATGPTLNYFNGIENAINIGVNKAFKYENIDFKYLFAQDYFATKEYFEDFMNYKQDSITKFLGKLDDIIIPHCTIPNKYFNYNKIESYYADFPTNKQEPTYNISAEALWDAYSVVFPTLQFILWTNPKKLYLVGCDCSNDYFDNTKSLTNLLNLKNGWNKFKNFANRHYPDLEIISVNPVGLKGIFKDVYTESYLEEHPEIREELGDDIEILKNNEVINA